ncbi:MAG: hypothetical protein V1702_00350 [Candidatus Woesearchaeota archaeon]
MGRKLRVNWTISPEADDILTRAMEQSKRTGRPVSKSAIVDKLIRDKLRDPVEVLKQEKREFAKKMFAIDEEIKALEETRTYHISQPQGEITGGEVKLNDN